LFYNALGEGEDLLSASVYPRWLADPKLPRPASL
jgi:hypothetical protein